MIHNNQASSAQSIVFILILLGSQCPASGIHHLQNRRLLSGHCRDGNTVARIAMCFQDGKGRFPVYRTSLQIRANSQKEKTNPTELEFFMNDSHNMNIYKQHNGTI